MATATAGTWKEKAEGLRYPTQAFIEGNFVDAASGERFQRISPASGEVFCEVAAGGDEDIDRAVAAARRAFDDGRWSSAPKQRKAVLMRLAELLVTVTDDLAALETLDTGKPISDALFEMGAAAQQFQYFAEAIDKVFGEVVPTAPDIVANVVREPVGVVGAVVPWNYALLMPVWKVAPALAAGNSVVLKPAEQGPLLSLRLAELAADAGVPDGVLNVVPGIGEVAGRAVGLHPDIDKVAFTGSTEVGKLFLQYAGQSNMKSVSLECGGKSPNIVLADAPDLDLVASVSAEGIFGNSGQVCNAGSRLLVDERVVDQLLEKLQKEASDWQPGDPFDESTRMGTMIDETQMKRVLGYIETGSQEGATLAAGGNRTREDSGGYYIEPTIFTDVNNEMRIAREEVFGPVLSTLTFSSLDEAIAIANDTNYGLAAGIWTRDLVKAHRFLRQARAGNVYVNTYDRGDLSLPFGGYKQSGFGRDKSLHAFENYTQLKSTFINLAG
jgi:gamma-glutamyl-gamma-aminobutyraldehyde dehydrogenase/4-guanidinobutyraldehyde dehydrogenase/NAD-dependent aldehyde dehydrogenase